MTPRDHTMKHEAEGFSGRFSHVSGFFRARALHGGLDFYRPRRLFKWLLPQKLIEDGVLEVAVEAHVVG